MRRKMVNSLRLVDVAGGCVVASILALAAWIAGIHHDRTQTDLRILTRAVARGQDELRLLRETLARKKSLAAELQRERSATRLLPTEPPVEEYFRHLSELAADHRLSVLRHNPLGTRAYPGLVEQRFAYEVAGPVPALLHFLRAIEQSPFWADVSYFKLDRGVGPEEAASLRRVALLTISLFAAPHADEDHGNGGA